MPSPPFSAVIFDLDGVLADSEPLHILAWQAALAPFGARPEPAFFHRWIGVTDTKVVVDLIAHFGLPAAPAALLLDKRRHLADLIRAGLQTFPGVPAAVASLYRQLSPPASAGGATTPAGTPMAVCTSSARADAELMLEVMGLTPFFSVVVAGDDVTQRKPHPEPYLLACARLGQPPAACAVLEDSPFGVESARAAGCTPLGIATTWGAAALPSAAQCFASTASAIKWLQDGRLAAPRA